MVTDETFLLKIILLGDPGVGKTSLRKRFMGEGFSSNYLKTLGVDISHFKYEMDSNTYLLSIWDLAGEDMYARVRQNYFMGAKGGFFVLDMTQPLNEHTLENWITDIKSSIQPEEQFKLSILANKSDLADERVLSSEDIENLITTFEQRLGYSNIEMFETSALTGTNITEAFQSQIRQILRVYDEYMAEQKQMRDYTNYPLAIFFMNDFGPQLFLKDFDHLEANDGSHVQESELESFLIQVSISLISAIGQGHSYIEGVFELPAGTLDNYRLLIASKRMNNKTAEDNRLMSGYAIFGFFVPKNFTKYVRKTQTVEKSVLSRLSRYSDINEITEEELQAIKSDILDEALD